MKIRAAVSAGLVRLAAVAGCVVMCCAALVGCAVGSALPPSESSALIKAALAGADCEQIRVGRTFGDGLGLVEGGATATAAQVDEMNEWLRNHVENNKAVFRFVSDEPYGAYGAVYGHHKTYEYQDGDKKLSVLLNQQDYSWKDGQAEVHPFKNSTVTLCASEPYDVVILDTTADQTGKVARVTFQIQWKLTPLATDLNKSGLTGAHPFEAPATAERSVGFQKLDATGWRIGPF